MALSFLNDVYPYGEAAVGLQEIGEDFLPQAMRKETSVIASDQKPPQAVEYL